MKRLVALVALGVCSCAGRESAAPPARLAFADVTGSTGVHLGRDVWGTFGAAWDDYDGDGDADLFVSRHTSMPALLRNMGNGSFADVTKAAGLDAGILEENLYLLDRHGCAWGDYDNDARPDLYCTTGAEGGSGSVPNQLFHNRGDGTFAERAAELGVDDAAGRGRSVSWVDFDLDGGLDLFVSNTRRASSPSLLYRREGSGFRDVTAGIGLAGDFDFLASGAAWCDRDGDRYADLFLAAYEGLVLRPNRGGRELGADAAAAAGIAVTGVRSLTCGDLDGDGHADLYVATTGAARLFRNRGDGTFDDATDAAGVSVERAMSSVMADFDNDGDTDLFVVRGVDANLERNQPDALFVNDGAGRFREAAAASGVAGTPSGSGDSAAVADFDGDGFLDLAVTNGSCQPDTPDGPMLAPYSKEQLPVGRVRTYARAPNGALMLFRNLGNANHWVRVRLNGRARTPFGTRVRVKAGGAERQAVAGDRAAGFAQAAAELHFGLGGATNVDEIAVEWPDGRRDVLRNLEADRVIDVSRESKP